MSEQSKHTPGEWVAYNSHGSTIHRRWRVGSRGHTPGVVITVAHLANSEEHISPEQEIANAHLIAAAPDLLNALRELLGQLESIGIAASDESVDDAGQWHGTEGLSFRSARRAIARAEGGGQ